MHTITIGKTDDINCKDQWTDFDLDPESEQTKMWIIKFDRYPCFLHSILLIKFKSV